jgi:hypothetical protein
MPLFGKKKESIKLSDTIFMSTQAKWNACLNTVEKNTSTIFIAWFAETLQQLQTFFTERNKTPQVILYRHANTHLVQHSNIVFVEHYPLHEKETTLFKSLNLKEVKIFSSLDEPLFQHFGGDKIITLIQNMGMQENEGIQHSLISKALKNAQQKVAEKVMIEQNALSQQDWFRKNLKDKL